MKKKLFILLGLLLIGSPSIACYGDFCSSYIGVIYDVPAKLWNKNVPPVVTNPRSVLDNPQEFIGNPMGNFNNNHGGPYKPTLNISSNPKRILCTNGSTCTILP